MPLAPTKNAALALVLITALASCGAPRHTAPNPLEIDRAEYSRVFDAAEQVLRQEGFTLDRRDYRFGAVTTAPRPSPTLFEVWVPTNLTAHQAVDSTLNDQRRIVVITLEPLPAAATAPATQPAEPRTFLMRVVVRIQQYDVPTRQLPGSTRGTRIQGHLHAVPSELADRGIPAAYWHDVGRDGPLEQYLLARIIRQSTRVAQTQPQP